MSKWILIALCALAACDEDRPTPAVDPARPDVPDAPAQEDPAGDRGWTGVTSPRQQVDVSSKLTGELIAVYVRAGDKVAKGDKLATIDDGPTKDEIKVAKSELRTARADRKRAEATADAAKRSLDRTKGLYDQGGTSQKAVDDAQYEYDSAVAAQEAAAARVSTVKARIDQLKSRLKEATIKAPFAGVVSTRYQDPGVLLQPSAPIVRLISDDGLWTVFAVPSDDAAKVREGLVVTVWLEGTETSVKATVRNVSPELAAGLQAIIVQAELDPADAVTATLRPSLNVRVKL